MRVDSRLNITLTLLLASWSPIKPGHEFESEKGWVCGKGLEGRKGKGKSCDHAII